LIQYMSINTDKKNNARMSRTYHHPDYMMCSEHQHTSERSIAAKYNFDLFLFYIL
jgi:hypothetical protein